MTDDPIRPEPFDVVLLLPGDPRPAALDGTPVDLSDVHELTDAEQRALLGSAVRIFPEDLTPRAYQEVAGLPIPRCFARSGWLHEHRALVLDEAARTGPVRFDLHEVLGLRIEDDET
ncbi:hypothetical protein B0I33_11446 [Prauserella shujinwangii]|uniref:Cas3 C-terminal domain-containing protein n=1 Tax=Prauserella shujinwangii TaxID=1453103 RepID=A0A2T0LKW8_9PSEU|nr:hypothetical protein [Prauserella shujinwangii]PRX43586.1 hypothetical protein B0I33_11446 [Prauserella shujinwangii]